MGLFDRVFCSPFGAPMGDVSLNYGLHCLMVFFLIIIIIALNEMYWALIGFLVTY